MELQRKDRSRLITELLAKERESISYFFDTLDIGALEKGLLSFLSCSGTVFFSGVGKSGIIAEKLATTMTSTGKRSLFLPPTNALHGDLGVLERGDLLVFLSKSGESQELVELSSIVKKRGIQQMAWVSSPGSTLGAICDMEILLPLKRELCPFDLAPTTSTVIQLIFGDVLAVALMELSGFTLDSYGHNHPRGLIGKKIHLRVEDIMVKGEAMPVCSQTDCLGDVLVELSNKRCGSLLVLNERGNFMGIFTDGDLRRHLQQHQGNPLKASMESVMTRDCLVTHKGVKVVEALALMQKDAKRRVMVLPVIEEKKAVGLLCMHDIIAEGIRSS